MKFTIIYKVFSIPSDSGNDNVKFEFTYEAELSELGDLNSHVNEYLQEYFHVGNYEIISIHKIEKE